MRRHHLYSDEEGILYLVAIMDWCTRKVLAWRISNTLEADFCVEALNEAIHKFGSPEIMNTPSHGLHANHCRATEQGSQFTSFARTDRLKRVGSRISMPLGVGAQTPAGNRRQRSLHGQHLYRTPLAVAEV